MSLSASRAPRIHTENKLAKRIGFEFPACECGYEYELTEMRLQGDQVIGSCDRCQCESVVPEPKNVLRLILSNT